ncbi:zinc-ribbon domain-containing protein [Arthrobacter crystallopoietes]|uniref:zinc-ribbon domain-containing protein n=1 Tax=Crystallibacter crystallopoietes TaxID=37928 RepID=UPI003D1DB644
MLLCSSGHCLHSDPGRATRDRGRDFYCGICAGSRLVEGVTSLADTDPFLAAQWDKERNGHLTSAMVLRGSGQKVWWCCTKGHAWPSTVANRAINGSGCPYCSAKAVLPGFNDLATTHPTLAQLWDPEVEQKQASQVSAGNVTTRIHLRCTSNHRFIRTPDKLVLRPFCPMCDGRIAAVGETDLATTHPHVASWWHPSKNRLKPTDVKAGSEKRVWWLCPDGHEFEQMIAYRANQKKQQCPVDTGRLLLSGVNDLATKHPDLVAEWNYELNDVSPDQIVPGTTKRCWTCEHGHTQHMQVSNRIRSGGCSECPPDRRVGTPTSSFRRGRQGWDKRRESSSVTRSFSRETATDIVQSPTT